MITALLAVTGPILPLTADLAPQSQALSAQPKASARATPRALREIAGPGTVRVTADPGSPTTATVSWSTVDHAEFYRIERAASRLGKGGRNSASATGFTNVATVLASDTSFTDLTLRPGVNYRYRITALAGTLASAHSPTATLTTATNASALAGDLLTPTDFVAATAAGNKVALSWGGTSSNQAVLIQRSLDAGLTWTDLVTLAGSTFTYSDPVARATLYAYRIKCFTYTAASPFTGSVSILSGPGEPASIKRTAVTTTSVSLVWAAVPGATGYIIEQAKEDGEFSPVATLAGAATTTTITGLEPGTVYAYAVRATNPGGASGRTKVNGALTISLAPRGLAITPGTNGQNSGFDITFNPVKGATSYVIERSSFGRPFQELATLPAPADPTEKPDYLDLLATAADRYVYRVKAVSEAGDSEFSGEAVLDTTPSDPSLPTADILVATPGPKGTTILDFDGSAAAMWQIQRYDAGAWKPFVAVPAGQTIATLKGLKAGQSALVRVVSFNGAAFGKASDSQKVVAVPLPVKAIRTLGVASASATSLALTWDAPVGANRYKLERSSDGATWTTLDTDFQSAAFADETIARGVGYSYRVSAGNATGYAAPSKPFKYATAPSAPASLSFSGTTLTWPDVEGETAYRVEGSTDGLKWSTAVATKANITTLTLKATKFSFYRVAASNKSGASGYSPFATLDSNSTTSPLASATLSPDDFFANLAPLLF